MRVLERRSYGAASVVVSRDGLVAYGRVTGPITAAALGGLAAGWSGLKGDVDAAVLDTTSAMAFFTLADMARIMEPYFERGLLRQPCAMLCTAGQEPMMREWAWRAAHYGVIRDVLPDLPAALEWAQDQAASLRAEATYRCGTSGR